MDWHDELAYRQIVNMQIATLLLLKPLIAQDKRSVEKAKELMAEARSWIHDINETCICEHCKHWKMVEGDHKYGSCQKLADTIWFDDYDTDQESMGRFIVNRNFGCRIWEEADDR